MIKCWQKIGSRPAGDFRIFTIRADKKISPRTRKEHEFYAELWVKESETFLKVIAFVPLVQFALLAGWYHLMKEGSFLFAQMQGDVIVADAPEPRP